MLIPSKCSYIGTGKFDPKTKEIIVKCSKCGKEFLFSIFTTHAISCQDTEVVDINTATIKTNKGDVV